MEKEKIVLNNNEIIETEKLIDKNDEIAKIFNKHFSETVDKLNLFEWPCNETDLEEDQQSAIINK